MKNLRHTTPALGAIGALGAAVFLLLPAPEAAGFSKLGGALGLTKRHFRIRNNFADAASNNNVTPHANYPGMLGADMALVKAANEWASGPRGDGTGDPNQTTIGDGGANFDFAYMGDSTGTGGSTSKVVSAGTAGCGGGVLAYVENGGDNWRMQFCEGWTWSDGPGFAGGGQFDIQGVGTHEFGHSLGLGHQNGSAVMKPSTASGNDTRNLFTDDKNGIQCIYGVKSGSKPEITDVSVSGEKVTITGSNFDATDNFVWFTNKNATTPNSNPTVIVSGVKSKSGNTTITVCMPADAGPGDVLVQVPGGNHDDLSNAYPFDGTGTEHVASSSFHNPSGCNIPNYNEVTPSLIGENWDTTVGLVAGDDSTALLISLNGGSCHAGGFKPGSLNGTELLALGPYVSPIPTAADGIYSIPISTNCNLLGSQYCTQGIAIRFGPLQYFGRNARFVTVGNTL